MFKKIINFFIILGLVYPTQLLAAKGATPKSLGLDSFTRVGSVDSSSFSLRMNGVVNEYRLIGYSSFPSDNLKEFVDSTKKSMTVLSKDFKISNSDFNDPLKRKELFRQFRSAFSAHMVLGHVDYNSLVEQSRNIRAEVESKFPRSSFKSIELWSERVQLETNNRMIKEFTVDQNRSVKQRILQAVQSVGSPKARALLNLKMGLPLDGILPKRSLNFNPANRLRHFRNKLVIPVKDQFGKNTKVILPGNPNMIPVEDPVKVIEQIKSGAVTVGMMGALIGAFIFLSGLYQTKTDFENKPLAFEQNLDLLTSAALPASVMSFFIGGALSQKIGGDLDVYRKSLSNVQNLIAQNKLGNVSPLMKEQVLTAYQKSIRPKSFIEKAMSNRGIVGGSIIAGLVFSSVDKIQSCLRLSQYNGLTSKVNYTTNELVQLENKCRAEWTSVWAQVMSSPQLYIQIVALLSTKTLISLGMNASQALSYGVFKSKVDRAKVKSSSLKSSSNPKFNKISFKARGLLRPAVRVVGGFAGFMIVFHVVLWGLESIYERMMVNLPSVIARDKLILYLKDLKKSGWDLESMCKSFDHNQNILKRAWNTFFNNDVDDSCGAVLAESIISNTTVKADEWTSHVVKPLEDAQTQWSTYLHKYLTTYNATYLFYKDIADQVKVKRATSKQFDFNLSPQNQWVYYDQSLPLFRSDPYYGLNYKTSGNQIAFPLWTSSGSQVDWEYRERDSVEKQKLKDRLSSFLKEVLPALSKNMRASWVNVSSSKREKAIEIVEDLESSDPSRIISGLNKIAVETNSEPKSCSYVPNKMNCDATHCKVNTAMSYDSCLFHIVQKDVLDPDIWSVSDDEKSFDFLPENLGAYSQVKKNSENGLGFSAFMGVKPLGVGQRFFIDYDQKLNNSKVDIRYFPESYQSLSDYLAYSLICGPEEYQAEYSIFGNLKSFDFIPVRPSYNLDIDSYCNIEKSFFSGKPNTTVSAKEPWLSTSGFYENLRGEGVPSYNTLSALLYNHLSDDFVDDFDSWWKTHVVPGYAKNFESLYQEKYTEDLVQGEFEELINDSDYDSVCLDPLKLCDDDQLKSNQKSSRDIMLQELDLYFMNVFDPMVSEFELDLRYSSYDKDLESDKTRAREELLVTYNRKRSQIYQIANAVTNKDGFDNFDDEMTDLYKLYFEEVSAHKEAQGISDITFLTNQLDVLKYVLYDRLFQLRLMFKAESRDAVFQIEKTDFVLLRNLEFSEEDKRVREDDLNSIYAEFREDFHSRTPLRAGKVIVEYSDWPDDLDLTSPMLGGVTFPAFSRIETIMTTYIETNKNLLSLIED